ncbi:B12-binding domain-containing radical SAM protein, partial [Thermoproteota archaeon]
MDVNNTQPVGYQVGLGYVAAVAKSRGHDVTYFAPQVDSDIGDLIKKVLACLPDVIAFSAVSTQYKFAEYIASEVKKNYKPKIICGGVHPTISPECIEGSCFVDAVVRGEGEYAFVEYLELLDGRNDYTHVQNFWFRENEGIIKNEIRPLMHNLDILPFPFRENPQFQEAIDRVGFTSFIFSRGCPFECNYCCNAILNRIYGSNHVRFRSAGKAIDEIDLVLSSFRVRDINFDDDNFTVNKEWFYCFVEKYKKSIKKKFMCNARVGTCNLDMFKMLKDANCVGVRIGVECGDEEYRHAYLNRSMTNKQIVETFKMAHEAGLKTYSFNIIGLPLETSELFEKTIDLNARLYPNHPFLVVFYPYPKTYLRDLCERDNLLIDRN